MATRRAGGSAVDLDIHRSPPSAPTAYTWCLTDTQLRKELSSVIAARSLPQDMSAVYFVFLPAGVDVCQDGGALCADNFFCAYHSSYGLAGASRAPIYAIVPYGNVPGCQLGQSPNGDAAADATIDLVSHEHNESITDPLGSGWFEPSGAEIGDKCVGSGSALFGNPLGGAPGAQYNQVINNNHYWLQDELSNIDRRTCEQRPGGRGTVRRATRPPSRSNITPVRCSGPISATRSTGIRRPPHRRRRPHSPLPTQPTRARASTSTPAPPAIRREAS